MIIRIELDDTERAERVLAHIGKSIELRIVRAEYATLCLASGNYQYSWEIVEE